MSLGETTVRKAAKAALKLYKLVEPLGWDRGLAEFRGEAPKPKNPLTLGDYLTEIATDSGMWAQGKSQTTI